MRELFFMIEVLHLTVTVRVNPAYDNVDKWEQLIQSHLPHLRIFDIHCDLPADSRTTQLRAHKQINQYTSGFWVERKWFIAHQFYSSYSQKRVLFRTANPYRYCSKDRSDICLEGTIINYMMERMKINPSKNAVLTSNRFDKLRC